MGRVAQLLLLSMDRAARDTARLAQLQRAASAWQASQGGRQRERRVQIQQALAVAGPVLARTVSSGGELDADDRLEARLAEGRLRDEMRGPRLLDDDVRDELERARRRGANVTVLDEGGLDGLGEASLAIIRAQLADTLRSASSDRLYIRTSPHETRRGDRRGPLRRGRRMERRGRRRPLARDRAPARRLTSAGKHLAPRPGGGGEPGRGAESKEARGGEAARPSPSGRLPENRPRGRTWSLRTSGEQVSRTQKRSSSSSMQGAMRSRL